MGGAASGNYINPNGHVIAEIDEVRFGLIDLYASLRVSQDELKAVITRLSALQASLGDSELADWEVRVDGLTVSRGSPSKLMESIQRKARRKIA